VVAVDMATCCSSFVPATSSEVAADPCLLDSAVTDLEALGVGSHGCRDAVDCLARCQGFSSRPSFEAAESDAGCALEELDCSIAGRECGEGTPCCEELYCVDSICQNSPGDPRAGDE
jgi:hypothetical protein